MPERTFSEELVLPDGRKVRVLAYDDGSVRMRLDRTPYMMEEGLVLSGGRGGHVIFKLTTLLYGSTAALLVAAWFLGRFAGRKGVAPVANA